MSIDRVAFSNGFFCSLIQNPSFYIISKLFCFQFNVLFVCSLLFEYIAYVVFILNYLSTMLRLHLPVFFLLLFPSSAFYVHTSDNHYERSTQQSVDFKRVHRKILTGSGPFRKKSSHSFNRWIIAINASIENYSSTIFISFDSIN